MTCPRWRHRATWVWAWPAFLLGLSAAAVAGPLNTLTAMEVEPGPDGARVRILGTRPPHYSVFGLTDPHRLIIDITDADGSALRAPIPVSGEGPVQSVQAEAHADARSQVARVIITLSGEAPFTARARGRTQVVEIGHPAGLGAAGSSSI